MSRSMKHCLTLAALATPVVVADLPVHCLSHQIVGKWRFTLGALDEKRTSCGHAHPDVETLQPGREAVDGNSTGQLALTLHSPNLVDSDKGAGHWTMVYDEGFEVSLHEFSFLAFSNFTFSAPKKNVSHCGQTMVGWYSTVNRSKFGCFYGVREEEAVAAAAPTKKAVPAAAAKASKAGTIYEGPLNHTSQKTHVAKLNTKLAMLQLGWRARVMPQWNGRTMHEINGYAGIKRTTPARTYHREMLRQRSNAMSPSKSFLQRADKLPGDFDWSNAGGADFLEPVMDQADCGSCYAASSVRMLTARHKIKMNDTQLLPWSISFPLHCSEYNQGCNGGYGFLLSKWSEDVGLLPANCMRYSTTGSCKLECDLSAMPGKRYRVGKHRYVGSYYGKANAMLIQEELYRFGPLAVGIEPDDDFMFYSDGIYRSAKSAASPTKAKLVNGMGSSEWEKVDHAVLLVGWGAETGQAYWRIQNSWGPDWGEDGYFRIARGVDEAAIESSAEAAEVIEDETKGKRVEELFMQLKDPLRAPAKKTAVVKPHKALF